MVESHILPEPLDSSKSSVGERRVTAKNEARTRTRAISKIITIDIVWLTPSASLNSSRMPSGGFSSTEIVIDLLLDAKSSSVAVSVIVHVPAGKSAIEIEMPVESISPSPSPSKSESSHSKSHV